METVPTVALPPVTPFTDHVTTVLDVPVTEAVNCCVVPIMTFEEDGATLTVIDGGGGGAELPPPQPEAKPIERIAARNRTQLRTQRRHEQLLIARCCAAPIG